MKNAAIFGSGVAVGIAGFAVFAIGALGVGMIALGYAINQETKAYPQPESTFDHAGEQ